MNFRETYSGMNRKIQPDEALIQKTIASARRKSARRMRPLIALAAVFACLALAVPVFAAPALAATPEGYALLYRISPATAQYFKPVNESVEDNGIRMAVDAIYIHDDTAEIYISMTDLIGGRIDKTIDLFDSYRIHRPFDSSATCSLVDYSAETQTARFLISITEFGGHKIEGDKLTFSVREFLSGKQEFSGELPGIDLTAAELDPETEKQDLRGYGGRGAAPGGVRDDYTALRPGTPLTLQPGVDLTAIGYVGGELRIQLRFADIHETDNNGYVWLENQSGERISHTTSASFWDAEEKDSFQEYSFSVSPDALADYTLHGYFVTCNTRTEGNWEITFPLRETE